MLVADRKVVRANRRCITTVHETLQVVLVTVLWTDIMSPLIRDYVATSGPLVKICSYSLPLSFLHNDIENWARKWSIQRVELSLLVKGMSGAFLFNLDPLSLKKCWANDEGTLRDWKWFSASTAGVKLGSPLEILVTFVWDSWEMSSCKSIWEISRSDLLEFLTAHCLMLDDDKRASTGKDCYVNVRVWPAVLVSLVLEKTHWRI